MPRSPWIFYLLVLSGWSVFRPHSAQAADSMAPPAWFQRVEVRDGTAGERVYPWNIVSATRIPSASPPIAGLRDFASITEPQLGEISASLDNSKNSSAEGPMADSVFRKTESGEEVPAFWEAIAPATYTIEFASPFVLHQVDLEPPLRKIGFSDFKVLVRGATEENYHPIVIEEATTSRGPTVEAGYLWEFRIRPEPIRGVRIEFDRGTLGFPDRIFLKDLDLWGE